MHPAARLLLFGVLAAAPGASAQTAATPPTPPPAGSLTVHSRPAGASIRFAPPQSLVGRAPVTVQRGPTGRFKLAGSAPGYETRRRTVTLAPGVTDTLWMTLVPKHPLKAAMRSLVLPGWGQLYDEHTGHAWVMGLAAAGTATALTVTHIQYRDKVDLLAELDLRYAQNPTPSNRLIRNAAEAEVERSRDARQLAFVATAGAWGLNVLDALVFGARRSSPLAFIVEPGAGAAGARVFAQARFR